METMVILVLLAIVWAAVGIYWLRTRVPSAGMSSPSYGRKLSSLGSMQTKRMAPVTPLRSVGGAPSPVGGPRPAMGPPGHSLTEPARRAEPGTGPRRGVSRAQARRRRRNVLLGLVLAAAGTLVAVFVVGGTTMVLLHLVADALLLGFVLLLVQYQREIELDRTRNLPVYAPPRRQLVATGTEGR